MQADPDVQPKQLLSKIHGMGCHRKSDTEIDNFILIRQEIVLTTFISTKNVTK